MSRSRRLTQTALAALAGTALLAGCGTGLEAQTYQERGRADGANADVGGLTGIAVRRLHVEPSTSGPGYAAGETAVVTGGLANDGSAPDALVGAASDAAASVALQVGGRPVQEIALAPDGGAPTDWGIALTGLTRDLAPAQSVGVTLVFRKAGRITLQVPVYAGDTGQGSRTPEQDPYEVK